MVQALDNNDNPCNDIVLVPADFYHFSPNWYCRIGGICKQLLCWLFLLLSFFKYARTLTSRPLPLGFERAGWTEAVRGYAVEISAEKVQTRNWQVADMKLLDLSRVNAGLHSWQ